MRITLNVEASHVAAILEALSNTGVANTIEVLGSETAPERATVVKRSNLAHMATRNEEEADTVRMARRVRGIQPSKRIVATRVAYSLNRKAWDKRKAGALELAPARRQVLDYIMAHGPVVGGFAEIARALKMNQHTVDGSVYWLRHNPSPKQALIVSEAQAE